MFSISSSFPSGRRLLAALGGTALASTAAMAADHPNLSGFGEPRNGSMHRGAPPAMTPAAVALSKQSSKNDDPNGVDETDRNCLPIQQPWNLYQSAPIDVVQDARETTMIFEGRSTPWHVFTDGRDHPQGAAAVPTNNGNSIGRWEGDEFVVDTVNFAVRPGHSPFNNLPLTSTMHVVERFKLGGNGNELHAHFHVEDEVLLTKPYDYDFVWFRDPPGAYAAAEICDARDPKNSHF
jgi:hypothetical protein